MNQKITMSSLVALLALKSGLSKDKSEEFLKEFFKLISENLRQGESVRLKSLGTFKIMTVETRKSVNVTNGEEIVIPEHKRIVFVPSRDVAEAVNAPFSMFDSVELHPDAEAELEKSELEEVSELETIVQPEMEKESVSQQVEVSINQEDAPEMGADQVSESSTISISSNDSDTINETTDQSDEIANSDLSETQENSELTEASENSELLETKSVDGKGKGRMRFIMGFISGLVLAMILVAGGYYYFIYRNSSKADNDNEVEEIVVPVVDSAVASDSAVDSAKNNALSEDSVSNPGENASIVAIEDKDSENVDTKPSDKVIKDIIGPHNYLTTMAQRHYGDYNLWAYIYEENKSFLGHPDRIKPGTEVEVPPLSKYGIDPKNPADVKKAKRLGIEIYNRFK